MSVLIKGMKMPKDCIIFVNGCWEDETDCIVCILKWLKREAGT